MVSKIGSLPKKSKKNTQVTPKRQKITAIHTSKMSKNYVTVGPTVLPFSISDLGSTEVTISISVWTVLLGYGVLLSQAPLKLLTKNGVDFLLYKLL